MTISRYKLVILSMLLSTVSAQGAYTSSDILIGLAALNTITIPAYRMTGRSWSESMLMSFIGSCAYINLLTAADLLNEAKEHYKLHTDKNYRVQQLVLATHQQNLKRIDQLLSYGANPNILYGKTVSSTDLHEANCAMYIQDNTALTMACHKKNLHIVRKLLKGGASPDIPSALCFRPLEIAARNNCSPLTHILLAHGADYSAIKCHSDTVQQFIADQAYKYHPRYKKSIREAAQLNGISEDSELTIVSFLHGDLIAKKEVKWRRGVQAAEKIMKKREALFQYEVGELE